MTIKSFNHRGYVLVPAFNPSGQVVSAICEEINFSMYSLNTSPGITYSSVIEMFKKKVDEIMNNNPEKELNRLKTLLENEPAVFYGTGQVYDLLTLCEDLVEASKKKEPKTKRVDELEVGDIVTLPYSKGVSTVSEIKGIRYKIVAEGLREPRFHDHDEEVTYFGNKSKGE